MMKYVAIVPVNPIICFRVTPFLLQFDEFTQMVIKKLWQRTASKTPIVREASFLALAAYAESNILSIGPVSSPQLYVKLLEDSDEGSRKACEDLIRVLLSVETGNKQVI